MSPDDDVTIAARGNAETANHFIGCRAHHPPHIIIEHVARPKPALVVVVPSVVLSKNFLVSVLVVICGCVLVLLVVELAIRLLTLAAILSLFAFAAILVILVLCHGRTARQSQQRRHTSSHPPLFLHRFSPIRTGISVLKLWVAVGVRLSGMLLHALYNRGRSACQFSVAHRFGHNCSGQFMRRELSGVAGGSGGRAQGGGGPPHPP